MNIEYTLGEISITNISFDKIKDILHSVRRTYRHFGISISFIEDIIELFKELEFCPRKICFLGPSIIICDYFSENIGEFSFGFYENHTDKISFFYRLNGKKYTDSCRRKDSNQKIKEFMKMNSR